MILWYYTIWNRGFLAKITKDGGDKRDLNDTLEAIYDNKRLTDWFEATDTVWVVPGTWPEE